MDIPREFTVNGVGKLSMSLLRPDDGTFAAPLQENTLEFTGLAFSIYAGLSILKKEQGRNALAALAEAVVHGWATSGVPFEGDISLIPNYVNEFLQATEADFPRVLIDHIGGADVVAEARRLPPGHWDGDLFNYSPKKAGGIYFNLSKVRQMAAASQQGGNKTAKEKRMSSRYRDYLFTFAVATAHELTHLFIGYLSQGRDSPESYTPPGVTHINYNDLGDGSLPVSGESGRWLENRLFGGSIEFFRDMDDDDDQAGLPFLLDCEARAWRVHPDCVLRLLTNTEAFNDFPFKTFENHMTATERRAQGLLSLGADHAPSRERGTFMRGANNPGQIFYRVCAEDLTLVPLEPGYVLSGTEVV